MKVSSISILIFLLCICQTWGSIIEQLATVCIYLSDKTTSSYGSGFFVNDRDDLYIVTADHVAERLTEGAEVVFTIDDRTPSTFSILEFIGVGKTLDWARHPHADVAVLKISITREIMKKNLERRFFPADLIVGEDIAPKRNVTMTLVGFPFSLGVKKYFSPISRETMPASGLIELNRFDKKDVTTIFFLTQDPSVEGFSGGPVFDTMLPRADSGATVIRSGNPKLVGLVHGTISDGSGGKFGAIVPARFILETIRLSK